jgi:hypothetical protein
MNLPDPPSAITGPLRDYLNVIVRALRPLPNWSTGSDADPNSSVTGKVGDYFTNIGSGSTLSRTWQKAGPDNGTLSTTSWVLMRIVG